MGVREHFELGETAVTVIAEERYLPHARRAIFEAREEIESFIVREPSFATSLEPLDLEAPPLLMRMMAASRRAGVGPMAAVAGTIADAALGAMVDAGAEHAIVDNGGDVAMRVDREVKVSLFSQNPRFADIGLRVSPGEGRLGICTSSGTVGPSISFGRADAATVISPDIPLADACATRLGNLVRDGEEDTVLAALEEIVSVEGVEGAIVICGDVLAMKGDVPELIRVPSDGGRITHRHWTH